MSGPTRLAEQQFGPRAQAYVQSAVHASGADLQQLAAIVGGLPTPRVLDVGCGGGHAAFAAAAHAGEVVACDVSADMLQAVSAEAKRRGLANLQTQHAPAEALPFADASFDLVCTRFSAHHWQDVPQALREMRRVLKGGGVAVLMDVISPGAPLLDSFLQCIEMLRDPSHVRDYSVAEWSAFATQAGLLPGELVTRKLSIDFASWIERMRTTQAATAAIGELQSRMDDSVRRHFAMDEDGNFQLDTMTLLALAPG
ncbi:class I SAM-dependent methyltransferase [Oleiagrimonas sp. C23AA]|uniref:class I SAM-dependent methyltransferase n=1 Tax=Oleiagrimonas sp. C23AA TaxID=2719047 RepID=UPI0014230E5B|nr:class I SAM-dependent methyltransferase [Oleiagrimonas sp. C23AA]NII10775.1 class I SAM-dependent methyltransferase [Oleiagrimonas sp. C23AA]